jgi:hypothetical protein
MSDQSGLPKEDEGAVFGRWVGFPPSSTFGGRCDQEHAIALAVLPLHQPDPSFWCDLQADTYRI